MYKPNVIIPGGPKCGSTYFKRVLNQHPEVYIQDLNFWSEISVRKRGMEYYFSSFKPKSNEKIIIDISEFTTVHNPDVVHDMKKTLPNSKIIFLIRNKKDQRLSVYNHLMNAGFLANVSFERYKEKYNYYEKWSDYSEMIKQYKELFDVFVFKIDNFNNKDLKKLTKFLSIEDFDFDLNKDRNITPDFVKGYSKIKRLRKIIDSILCFFNLKYYWDSFKERMGYWHFTDEEPKYKKNKIFGFFLNIYLKIKLPKKQREYYMKKEVSTVKPKVYKVG